MTVKAKVKGIYTTEMNQLESIVPDDFEQFCLSVRAMVGPDGGEGEESFDINVCTPKWLMEVCQAQGFALGRHYLVVDHYDLSHIKRVIIGLIEACEGDSWKKTAERVGRIGYWEFEDYEAVDREADKSGSNQLPN